MHQIEYLYASLCENFEANIKRMMRKMVLASIPKHINMKRIRSIFAEIRFEANKKSCEHDAPEKNCGKTAANCHEEELIFL